MQRLEVLFAAEHLLPAVGGAELHAVELAERLAWRGHRVRAVQLGCSARLPRGTEVVGARVGAPADGYWRSKRLRREAVGLAVAAELGRRPADVVVAQLHAVPAAVEAATGAGTPTLVLLPSYESLCKYAFDADSGCGPAFDCAACVAAQALPADEREELLRSREAHARALGRADALVACSRAVADAAERWCGRAAAVVFPVLERPRRVEGDHGGPLVAAARWSANKGLPLVEQLAASLPARAVAVVRRGLDESAERRLGRLANVRLVEPAPVEELATGASVVLVPSQWPEPFGRVAFEALGAGVPALASRVGGLREHVPDSLLVDPPDDVAAWVAAVRRLEDPSAWAAARAAGLRAAAGTLRRGGVEPFELLLVEAARRSGRAPRRAHARSR